MKMFCFILCRLSEYIQGILSNLYYDKISVIVRSKMRIFLWRKHFCFKQNSPSMSRNLHGGGHIDFSEDPVGVDVGVDIGTSVNFLSAQYLRTTRCIFTKFSRMYNLAVTASECLVSYCDHPLSIVRSQQLVC